jgi:hypothetical protein
MKQFIFGFIAALALIAVGGLAYIKLGLAPVATASPARRPLLGPNSVGGWILARQEPCVGISTLLREWVSART